MKRPWVCALNSAGQSACSTEISKTTQPAAGSTYTLNIHSLNPSSGVKVSSFVGNAEFAFGTTPTARDFASGATVTVTCPTTAGGMVFQKWQLDDGNDLAFTTDTTVTMNGPHTLTAVYGSGPLPQRVLASLTIEGPSELDERTSADYQARAAYTDGTSRYVTATATWKCDSSYASFSDSGRLDADAVSRDRDIEIEAEFTEGGVPVRDTKTVTIRNTDEVPTYTLTFAVEGGGSISRSPRGTSYDEGTEVSLRANRQTGWLFSHWSGDASGTENETTVRMSRDRSVTAHFIVDTSVGGIRTIIQPPEAVAAGATWGIVARTSGESSGETVAGLNVRDYFVNFATVPGFVTPDIVRVTVEGGVTKEVTGLYQEIPGTVQVAIEPAAASLAGARWRLDGGAWLESSVNILNVSSGGHQIEFLAVAGWSTPAAQAITVQRAGMSLASGQYGPPAGLPLVTAVSPKTGPLAGGTTVTIDGANFLPGANVTFGGVAAASVTVVSSTRITAVTPPRASYGSVALVLTSGGQTVTQANGFSYLNASGANMELVGQIGGHVQAVAVVGNLVYYGEGPGLVVADFTNPAAPVERGRIALPGVVTDVVVVNNIAFVTAGGAGLYTVDVSISTAPSIVGFFDTEGSAAAVAVLDGVAYVADEYTLQIFDVTNPAAIVRLGEFDTPGPARRVAIGRISSKRYAFVAESYRSDSALRAIDVTTPNAAVEVATVLADGNAGIIDVKLVGTMLYVSDGEGRVKIFDASNPANLVQIGSRGRVGSSFIDVVENRLYACSGGLKIVDLSVTPNPPEIGAFGVGSSCYDLVVANGLALAAMGSEGLKVVDVSNPASMSLRSAIQTLGGVEDVWVSGAVAYVGNGSGLHTVDVSNPARPVRLATMPGDRVTHIVVADGKATLVNYGDEVVRVVNVANPSAPSVLGTYTGFAAWNIALMGATPVLAAATGDDVPLPMLDVLNLSSPSNPQSHGSVLLDDAGGIASAVAVAGNWAFVGRPNKALDVVSLANPGSPQKVGSVPIPNSLGDVAVSEDGNWVCVGDSSLGIQVVDVTVKTAPVFARLIDPPHTVEKGVISVQVSGNRLVATESGFNFVFVFDISNPASPQMLGYYDIPGAGWGISVVGDLIFVAGYNAGVTVLRLVDVDQPTVAITSPTANSAHAAGTALLTLGGTASDDQGVTRVSWVNDRGGGGIATGTTSWQISGLPLAAGVNVITVTAEDANGNLATDSLTVTLSLPDTTAPAITITGPRPDAEFAVSTGTVTLTGSVADNQSIASVTWSNGSGGSGPAALAGQTWAVADVPLVPGPNVIQMTATDVAGNTASDTAVIFLVPPDTAPPLVTIDFPTANAALETQSAELNLSGLASDDQGVARVEWSDGRGGQGAAAGTSPWSVNGIVLQPGLNVIEVTAFDAAGNAGTDSLAVTCLPPPLELQVLGVVDGIFRFQVSGPAGSSIAIQRSSDFNEWEPLGTRTLPPEGSTTVEDDAPLDGQHFYRVLPQEQ